MRNDARLDKELYRIYDKENKCWAGAYSRSYGEEFEFNSEEEARTSNYYGIYENKEKYDIIKFKVSYKKEKK